MSSEAQKAFDQALVGSLERLNNSVDKLTTTVNDMRVMIAENYMKKSDFEEHTKIHEEFEKKHETWRTQIIGWVFGSYALIVAAAGAIISMLK